MNKLAAEKIAQEYYQLGQALAIEKISEAMASPLDTSKIKTEEEAVSLLRNKGLTDKAIAAGMNIPGNISEAGINIPAVIRGKGKGKNILTNRSTKSVN